MLEFLQSLEFECIILLDEAEKVFRILSSGAHAHTISGAPSVSVSVSNANTGGGGAHENRPPYYALCYIMRIS